MASSLSELRRKGIVNETIVGVEQILGSLGQERSDGMPWLSTNKRVGSWQPGGMKFSGGTTPTHAETVTREMPVGWMEATMTWAILTNQCHTASNGTAKEEA